MNNGDKLIERLVELGDDRETAISRAGYLSGLLTPDQLETYFMNRRLELCHVRSYSYAQSGQQPRLAEFPGWLDPAMQ